MTNFNQSIDIRIQQWELQQTNKHTPSPVVEFPSDKTNELNVTADTESTTDTSFDPIDYFTDDNLPTDLSDDAVPPSAPLFDYEFQPPSEIKSNITTHIHISTKSTALFDSNDFSAKVSSPTDPSVNAADISPTSTNNSTKSTASNEILSIEPTQDSQQLILNVPIPDPLPVPRFENTNVLETVSDPSTICPVFATTHTLPHIYASLNPTKTITFVSQDLLSVSCPLFALFNGTDVLDVFDPIDSILNVSIKSTPSRFSSNDSTPAFTSPNSTIMLPLPSSSSSSLGYSNVLPSSPISPPLSIKFKHPTIRCHHQRRQVL